MKVVVISGFFNPLHVGHLDYIENGKKLRFCPIHERRGEKKNSFGNKIR